MAVACRQARIFSAAGSLEMTIEMLQKVFSYRHPDFQLEAAKAVPKKRDIAARMI
jgi:hypothetical protein